ncbi:Glycoside hydrolase family 32 [Penicillium samsonianum]|uniref:Glycoside hydrolase family 32 n=1 Tax=Penicillium samsonianum TaxID=1882272 RepID=UPI0025496AEB|nr:Glycoside hydrolase family 32 [Penicillium samsonianum]KAJ6125535.1 Glycoside hydrolase family 32 [Penicillium samsonianum]
MPHPQINLADLPALPLSETWRPHTHVLPPDGQIGDPCAHYNDPETGLFYVGFLHNGTGIASVLTNDLVYYYDVRPNGNYSIVAGGPNDPLAVFDGSVIPSGVDGKPTLLYTSVSALPIHWTLPYTRGTESQSLAVTYDGRKNFTKLEMPPFIPEPPAGVDVTGFRDPYVFQNGEFDRSLDNAAGTWYTIISGGIHDVGPGIFLYQNTSPDFKIWVYLGEWFHKPANSTWGSRDWSKTFGYNFETSNVFDLTREGYSYNGSAFMTIAAESSYEPIQDSVSSLHAQLWAAGAIATPEGENVTFIPDMVGVFDWGLASYAAVGKVLPKSSHASTASGAPDRFISCRNCGLPDRATRMEKHLVDFARVVHQIHPYVVNNDLVQETGSWRVAARSASTEKCVELETLGIDIARETYGAMTSAPAFREPARTTSSEGVISFGRSPKSRFFILEAEISFDAGRFQILASEFESTTIYYQFSNKSIMIDRSQTSAAGSTTTGIDASPESGRLRLFDINESCGTHGGEDHSTNCKSNPAAGSDAYTSQSGGVDAAHIETLSLTMWWTTLSLSFMPTIALCCLPGPWYQNSTEIRFFQNGEGEASYSNIRVADGLYDAYPDRLQ